MLSPRWRKVWRDAWLHRTRTLLVVLAIAVALAGAGTILDTWALVQRATEEGYLASNPASATLRTDSIDAALLERVRAVPNVRDAQARRTVSVLAQVQGAWRSALIFAYDDLSGVQIGRLRPEAGVWPPAEGTFVLERSSVEYAATGVGDSITLAVREDQPRALPVTGIVRDVGLAPGWMEHVVYGFATTRTLAQLGLPSSLSEVQIIVGDDCSASRAGPPGRLCTATLTQDEARQVAYRVKAAIEATGRRVTDVDVPIPGEHMHAAQMDSLLYTQGAFGLLALLTCAFLVVNLISAMLAGQVREIGVMKTLGAQEGQLTRMYLALAAGLGVLASLIAVPVAWYAGRIYGGLKAELLNFDVTLYDMPLWAVALQVAVGIMVPVLAAAVPVRRGARVSVAAALRDVGITHDGRNTGEPMFSRRGGLSRVTLLSIRNAFRRRQRMILTLVALASGGSVYLGARNLRQSVIGSLDLLFGSQRYDFSVRLAEPHAADSMEAIVRAVAGVERAEGWTGAQATVEHRDATSGNTFTISAVPVTSRLYAPMLTSGRWLAPTDSNAMVVGRALVKGEPGLQVGHNASLVVGGRRSTWRIVGTVDGGPSPTAFTTPEVLARVTGDHRRTTVVVSTPVDGLASQVDLIQRVRGALTGAGIPVVSSQLLAENRRVTEDHLLMVVDFLAVMGWVMIAVGGMGLAATMGLAVLERTREIGVLRAIGARHPAILAMIEIEGLVVALLGWLVALPLSVPMSAALGAAFGRVMFRVPLTILPELRGVLAWLGIVVVVSLVACAWPAVRATRGTIAAALAYE